MKIHPFLVAFAFALVLPGCDTDHPQPAPTAAAPANGPAEQKSEFVASMENRLHDFDAKIARLKRKSVELKGDAKAQADKALDELNVQRDKASRQLEELKRRSASAWEDVKAATASAMDDLKDAYENLKERFQ